ncbi:MAG: D-tyrosyl-tRNA(Tyr) deacylase [Desulfobacterales bacterium]|nr:D-tyrosyl-tRNA(Tyr) deacylase [Desulfobacterales bacterium]
MRAVIQRVSQCSVNINEECVGKIGKGLLVLLGVSTHDMKTDADYVIDKLVHLRIFEDDHGKMNLSLLDVQGELMVVSQFTLYADCRKGRRPSFVEAADPEKANTLYEYFIHEAKKRNLVVQTGKFGAMMAVSLINDGPVTIILESKQ